MNGETYLLVKASIDKIGSKANELGQIFYRRLFLLEPELETLFREDSASRNAKFSNMLATFKNTKDLDKIESIIEALGERHVGYAVKPEHYEHAKQALLGAVEEVMGKYFTDKIRNAWMVMFDSLADIMKATETTGDTGAAMGNNQNEEEQPGIATANGELPVLDSNLLDSIGGRSVVYKVHQRFYNTLFDDKWLGKFFYGKSKDTLIRKQTDFMVTCFGGPNNYEGGTPGMIHMHMFITDEMLDLRQQLLGEAIRAEGLSEDVVERWLQVDDAFRKAIAKKSEDECVLPCPGQGAITAKKPGNYPWPVTK